MSAEAMPPTPDEVSRERPPAVSLPDRSASTNSSIILPRWIYIKDWEGRYLTVRSEPQNATLTFRDGAPDLNCIFEPLEEYPGYFRLLGANGSLIMRYNNAPGEWWYTANPTNSVPIFRFVLDRGDIVHLEDLGSPQYLYMSNRLAPSGAPIGLGSKVQSSEMTISIAAVRTEIIDVRYDIPGGVVREYPPFYPLRTSVRNESHVDVTQPLGPFYYEKRVVGTWNNAAGIELGVTSSFTTEVPFVASASFEILVRAASTHEWGGKEGVREIVTESTTVTVPPRKMARAMVVVRNAQIEVRFTYTQRVFWSNGRSQDIPKTGIYTNVDIWDIEVVLDNLEDI